MTVFRSDKHLASWGGQCRGNDQSAGKRRSGKTGKGSRWLGIALTEAALAATHQKDTYLAAQYRRLRGRRGHKKALGAVKHSIISPSGTCSPPARSTSIPAKTSSTAASTRSARSSA